MSFDNTQFGLVQTKNDSHRFEKLKKPVRFSQGYDQAQSTIFIKFIHEKNKIARNLLLRVAILTKTKR